MRVRQLGTIAPLVALLLGSIQPAMATDKGSLIVRVSPKETYIYADGEPVYESKGHYITLDAGEHKIDLYNYGFKPETRSVTITAHHTLKLDVEMQKIPGMVSGPWGCITIEGPHGAAILLNGKEPDAYFVGNVKEFDNEFLWKKELLVPPGRQELTVAYAEREPWTVTVDVEANKRVVVDAFKGVRKTVDWSRGEQMNEVSRFHGGLLSDHVAIEKVSGQFTAATGQVNCGQSTQLTWSSNGAMKTEINGAPVSASGDQTVEPKQNTTYKFTAAGPGGTYTSDATVSVNNEMPVTFNVTPAEVNVQNNGQSANPQTATVTWSAPNANSVTIDNIGTVDPTGSREVPITTSATGDQTVTYTLHATNACGGSETRTATLHIMGPNGPTQGAVNPPAETQTAQAEPAPALPQSEAPAPAPAQLPHTASQLPLMALTGFLFLVAAALFRIIVKTSA